MTQGSEARCPTCMGSRRAFKGNFTSTNEFFLCTDSWHEKQLESHLDWAFFTADSELS